MSAAEAATVGEARAPDPSVSGVAGILRAIITSVAWNAVVPVLLYQAAKTYLHASEFQALVIATLFPVAESVWGLARERNVDPIAGVVLFGILVDLLALTLGGSPRLLLIRESFATGALGVACFLSLLLPRPLMFYFGRYFFCGHDTVKQGYFDQSWTLPYVRHGNRLITSVWGIVFTGELVIRVVLVFTVSVAAVLVVSPLILGALTVFTIVWTLAYAGRLRSRVLPILYARGAGAAQAERSIQAPPRTCSPS